MCAYMPEWYGFEIHSKRHIMDLLIEPSFNQSICTQFHETEGGEYKAFYNFEPSREVFVSKIQGSAKEIKTDPTKDLGKELQEICANGLFSELCPVEEFILNEEERRIIDSLYNNELLSDVKKSYGLDGHSYYLTLYKDRPLEYYTWAFVPKEWQRLTDVINIVIEHAGLDKKYYGVHVVLEKTDEMITFGYA